MESKNTTSITKMQEKRAQLIELSEKAKKIRAHMVSTATTAEGQMFWETRTVNYMLLNYVYTTEETVFQTFNQWKEKGATIKKGAKATVIWGQPRKGGVSLEDKLKKDPHTVPVDDPTAEEYEFFPLCYLFSEHDVHFTNIAESAEQQEQPQPQGNDIIIDSAAIDEL